MEREREKIKSLKMEKEREEAVLRTKEKMKKSQSLHEANLDFSKGNQGVLRQFAKDYSVLSKIYRRIFDRYMIYMVVLYNSREETGLKRNSDRSPVH